MATGQELVTSGSSADIATLDRFDEILLSGQVGGVDIVDDPDEIRLSILQQLLSADSDEELQDFGNAQGWRELLDVPVELHGFRWRNSTIEGEGSPVYVIVSATRLDDGDRVTLTTGSSSVLAQLSNMARRGALIGSVWQLHQSDKETQRGFRPFWLVQPEAVKQAAREARQAATSGGDGPAAPSEPETATV